LRYHYFYGWEVTMPELRLFRRSLSLCAMIVSTAFASLVGAANGATSVTSGNGEMRWGFLIAIAVAILALIIGALFIIVRSRREYLAMKARKASRPPDEEN
jgi:membrane associated rhomboid family serine protease